MGARHAQLTHTHTTRLKTPARQLALCSTVWRHAAKLLRCYVQDAAAVEEDVGRVVLDVALGLHVRPEARLTPACAAQSWSSTTATASRSFSLVLSLSRSFSFSFSLSLSLSLSLFLSLLLFRLIFRPHPHTWRAGAFMSAVAQRGTCMKCSLSHATPCAPSSTRQPSNRNKRNK